MRTILYILTFVAVVVSCGKAFAEQAFDVRVVGVDIYGVPALTDTAGTPIRENVFARLHRVYAAPDFAKKRDQVLASSDDADGLLVLSAIWKDIAPGAERDALRDSVVKRILGVDLQKGNSDDVFATDVFEAGYAWSYPEELADYMLLMLLDRFCVMFPSVGETGRILECGTGRAQMCRLAHYCSVTGGDDEESRTLRGMGKVLQVLPTEDRFKRLLAQTEIYKEILSREPFLSGVKSQRDGEAVAKAKQTAGSKDSGVRLLYAIEQKDQDPDVYKAEVSQLCAEFFPPAFPFMAEICHKERRFEDAAYFHYLFRRNPLSMFAFLERVSGVRPAFGEKLLYPQASQYFSGLMSAGLYEEAKKFCAYAAVFLSHDKSRESTSLRSEMESRLARQGMPMAFRDIQPWLGNQHKKNYANETFDARFRRELAMLDAKQTERKD